MTDFDWQQQHVLITGATGNLGRELVTTLAELGAKVRILTRKPFDGRLLWPDIELDICQGDLAADIGLEKACTNVDIIFHLASYAPDQQDPDPEGNLQHYRVTTDGTRHLLTAATQAKVKHITFISSSRVLDTPSKTYALAKQQAENLLLDAGQNGDLDVSILRLPPIYGISHGTVPLMMQQIQNGTFPALPETGNKRSMIHIDDAIRAMLLLTTDSRARQQVYLATDGNSYSTREVYELICKAINKPPQKPKLPFWSLRIIALLGEILQKISGKAMPLNHEKWQRLTHTAIYDDRKIRDELDFMPERTLSEALTIPSEKTSKPVS